MCSSGMLLKQQKEEKKLERIQGTAAKMVPELSNLTYEERLKYINLPSLEPRRERRDLKMLFKVR